MQNGIFYKCEEKFQTFFLMYDTRPILTSTSGAKKYWGEYIPQKNKKNVNLFRKFIFLYLQMASISKNIC